MNLPALILTVQFLQVPVKALVFCEEVTVRKIAIQDPNRVMLVQGSDQLTACVLNCLEMAGSDVSSSAGECEIFQFILSLVLICVSLAPSSR